MSHPWIQSVRERRQLKLYSGPSLAGGPWAVALQQAVRDFNALSGQHRLGVTFVRESAAPQAEGGADVSVDAAADQISFAFGGSQRSEAFSGERMHGRTFHIRGNGGIEKAFVYLPARPMVTTPRTRRAVGPNVLNVILVHELVHACGLSDREHTPDDLFQGYPEVDAGGSAAEDRVRIQRRSGWSWMPPLVLSGSTVRLLRDLWS